MKILKITLLTLLSVFVLLYVSFLFILPNVVNLNKYNNDISKAVQDATGFKVKTENIKISTGWNLSAGARIGQADLLYPTGEKFAQVKNLEVKLSLLPLFMRQIKIDSVNLDDVILRLGIEKDGKFQIEKFLPKTQTSQPAQEIPMGLKISDNMPNVSVKKYSLSFVDIPTGKKYSLKGSDLKITDFLLNKKIKVKTLGNLTLDGRKQINYDVALFTKAFSEAEPAKTAPQPFNIITVFKNIYKYNLTADIKTDLKISSDNNIDGDFSINNISMVLDGVKLPKSDLDLKFAGNKIKIDSNFYTDVNEKAVISGVFNNGKHQSIDLKVKSDKTDLSNTFLMANTLLQLVGNNDLKGVKAKGHLAADFNIKSDFKKIQSKGSLKVENASVLYSLYNIALNNINADIDFSNNNIKINKSSANLNGAPLSLKGKIDSNANADITVDAVNLPLKGLLATLGQIQILRENDIYSGAITIKAALKGRLDKATPIVDVTVNNVSLKNKPNKALVKLDSAKVKLTSDGKKTNGGVNVAGVKVIAAGMPSISVPTAIVTFNEKDLSIVNAYMYLNNSKIDFFGKVTNYATNKLAIDITAKGLILASDIRTMLPPANRKDIKAVGKLPLVIRITGDAKSQEINAQVLANQTNNITVIDINSLRGKTSLINVAMKLADNNLKISDASLYSLSANKGLSGDFKNNVSSGVKVIAVKGSVGNVTGKNPQLNNISVSLPSQIALSIPGFAGSNVQANGDLSINGSLNNPEIKGYLNLPIVSIPTMKTYLKNLGVHFNKNSISVNCNDLKLAESIMGFNAVLDNNFSKGVVVRNVDFNANMIDLDSLGAAFASMPQNAAAPGVDLGVTVLDGQGNVNKFKTGGLVATNLNADFDLKKNLLKIKNITGDSFSGKIAGDVSYNIVYGNIGLNLQGRGMSAGSAFRGLTGLPEALSGKLDFDADLKLRGYSQEDLMRSLNGNASFIVSDGQMGTLGKLEHLLYAQNILSNNMFKTTLGVIAKAVTVQNTGFFKYIKGKMTFNNGWANISYIQTSGPSMSMYISGRYNILNNSANLVVLGRLSSNVVQLLGPIGDFSMDKLLSYIPKVGTITAALVNQMTTNPDDENISMIPPLTPKTSSSTKEFKAVINGGIESQSSVKSFKWLSNPQFESASPVNAQNLQNTLKEAGENLRQTVQSGVRDKIQQYVPPVTAPTKRPVADFINSLPDLR